MYEILYQRVFSELDRRENSFKQNLTPDTNNVSTTFYQNGFGEDDGAFKDDGEDNTGWTEVKSRSSKGWLPSRGGVLPYITYTGMCRPKGSWFWSS